MDTRAVTEPSTTWPFPSAGTALSSAVRTNQSSFAEVLGREGTPDARGESPAARARSTAEQLVAVALVQPLLARMRESGQAAPPFAPTAAEKQFMALQDAGVALQMVHASRFPLVERLARDMLERGGARPDTRSSGSPSA